MDSIEVRNSAGQLEIPARIAEKKSYASPTLYVYGKLDDLTEYAGASGFDGIVGNSIAP